MVIELEKQPKTNQFYWYTSNKTYDISDVTFKSIYKRYYGFKDVPDYETIESYSLRFKTHCSLDELIEQFR